jgi:hypothetical protein
MRNFVIAGLVVSAPISLLIVWFGLHSIRESFGVIAHTVACIGGMATLLSFAFLVDMQAERRLRQWLAQHGLPPLER